MRALVCVPIAPLYDERGGERVDEALSGMTAEILRNASGRCLVRTQYGYEGWANAAHLRQGPAAAAWEQAELLVVRSPFADILATPRVQATTLCTLPRGARVRPLGDEENGWRQVCAAGGQRGYVWEALVAANKTTWRRSNEAALREGVAAAACDYLGVQYRWGGKTPMGIDCSGLCSMAYLLEGVFICRDAQMPAAFPVREIPRETARRADLLFFPGHMALYLGGGRFVHATAAARHCVTQNSLSPSDPLFHAELARNLQAVGSIF